MLSSTTTSPPSPPPPTSLPSKVSHGSNKDENENNTASNNISFLITGFGAFQGVPSNPTTVIAQNLEAYLKAEEALKKNHHNGDSDDDENDDANSTSTTNSSLDFTYLASNTTCRVIQTSANDVRNQMDSFFDQNVFGKEEEEQQEEEEEKGPIKERKQIVILHLGIDAKSTCFKLEKQAYNEASFRIPDEEGYQPSKQPIDDEYDEGIDMCLHSSLDLDWVLLDLLKDETEKEEENTKSECTHDTIVETVTTKASAMSVNEEKTSDCVFTNNGTDDDDDGGSKSIVKISTNAGRFVCNYTYWYSLNKATKNEVSMNNLGPNQSEKSSDDSTLLEVDNEVMKGKGDLCMSSPKVHVLFLHVPPFKVISCERQMEFVVQVMNSIRKSLSLL